jgi:uncharacterized membrane protein YgaE (UPF0421/DUF939 family)
MTVSVSRVGSGLRTLAWQLARPPDVLPPLVVQCIKVAVGCGVAWWLGPFVHLPHPWNAVLAVIILMQGHAYGSLLNALEFLLGVAAGLGLGIAAHHLLGISAPVLAGVIFVCLLMGGWLKISTQGFNNQIAISALLVLASGSATNVGRLWETVLGGAVGVVVSTLLWPPNPVGRLRQEYRNLKVRIGSDVLRSVELAGQPDPVEAQAHQESVHEHSERADEVVAAVGPAEDALRWNPWHAGRIYDLSRLEDRLRLISYLYRTVRALARQTAKTSPSGREAAAAWDAARPDLLAAGSGLVDAVDRRLMGHDARDAVGRARKAVSRFAAAVPRERHAVAVAAVLEDLLSDVEGWRPNLLVDPERQLVTRILRRLGRQRPSARSLAVEARLEFEEELAEARKRDLTGALTRQPRTAPLLADIVEAAGITNEVDRGLRDIPVGRIRGPESPSLDFDLSFLPRGRHLLTQWVRLYMQMEEGRPIDPIDVYQVGDAYFLKHGHDRVSVARRLGWARIRAHVVEVTTRAPVGAEPTNREVLQAAEYATFLERTELDRTRPEARLACSRLGRFDVFFDHILGHRYFLGVERGQQVSVPEAAASWYDSVYRPLMEVARAHELQLRLPGWTDADIYLALSRLWLDLEAEGRPAGPESAAEALLADPAAAVPALGRPRGGRHRERALELVRRLVR